VTQIGRDTVLVGALRVPPGHAREISFKSGGPRGAFIELRDLGHGIPAALGPSFRKQPDGAAATRLKPDPRILYIALFWRPGYSPPVARRAVGSSFPAPSARSSRSAASRNRIFPRERLIAPSRSNSLSSRLTTSRAVPRSAAMSACVIPTLPREEPAGDGPPWRLP
jgi:hypothetical protein